jgi:hypothetical protein
MGGSAAWADRGAGAAFALTKNLFDPTTAETAMQLGQPGGKKPLLNQAGQIVPEGASEAVLDSSDPRREIFTRQETFTRNGQALRAQVAVRAARRSRTPGTAGGRRCTA